MREPIHNQVAQEFLIQFLRGLAELKDVHESLTGACQSLKFAKHLTYPSAHLVPLFRLHSNDLKSRLRSWLPTRRQAASLLFLSLLSLLLPVQGKLLEQRLWMQALYRHITHQGTTATPPPITLVQIDSQSIQAVKLTQVHPIDRRYLATIVNRLAELDAEIIGIDYLFDRPAAQPQEDQALSQAIQSAIQQPPQSWFVFVDMQENNQWVSLLPLANPNQSLVGDMHLLTVNGVPTYMKTVISDMFAIDDETSRTPLPFSYLLALSQKSKNLLEENNFNLTQSSTNFQNQIINNLPVNISNRAQLQPLTALSYQFNQLWLHPIIDFSIPPDQIYRPISAETLLSDSSLPSLKGQIVILAAGIYNDAGIIPGQDNYRTPAAVRHWRSRGGTQPMNTITGGEVHAYMTQAFTTNRLAVPIPDLWMIGIAALLGKSLTLYRFKSLQWRWLLGGTVIYGLLSLQVYISAAIVLPILLPVLTFWTYILPALKVSPQK